MPTIYDLGIERPKLDAETTYLEKNNIDESIRQNIRKNDVYKLFMYKIYNVIVGQTNEQLQEKPASEYTFRVVKTYQDPIGYLMILKRLCFSNQSNQNPIRTL